MNIKYLRYLRIKHWVLLLLPLYVLPAVLMVKGVVEDRMNSRFAKIASGAQDVFRLQLGNENAAFADALSKEKNLTRRNVAELDHYLGINFLNSQLNHVEKNDRIKKSAGAEITAASDKNKETEASEYSLSSVFIGKKQRFAVINDKIVKNGEILENGETVVRIEESRVLLNGRWGERWLFVKY